MRKSKALPLKRTDYPININGSKEDPPYEVRGYVLFFTKVPLKLGSVMENVVFNYEETGEWAFSLEQADW